MTEAKRVYWDACAWLGLINGETDKAQALEYVWQRAKKGDAEIWTSSFSRAEVYRVKCEGDWTALDEANDAKIDALFDQDFVKTVQVDDEIGKLAKKLLRTHQKLKKPSDAIHLASAVYWNLDQLHTYDGSDLLGLEVFRDDGQKLEICKPDMIDGETLFTLAKGKE